MNSIEKEIEKNSIWQGVSINKIYNMDCIEGMKLIPDGSIDLTVTSPPYDNLRTYNWYSWDFEWVAKELFRVTKQWGVVVWVVWDWHDKWWETLNSFRQAIYFQEIWLTVHDTIIYKKSNFSVPFKDKYHQTFEYMFILSKWKKKTFNPLIDRINKKAWKRWWIQTIIEKDGSKSKRDSKIISDYWKRHNVREYNTGNNNTTKDKIAIWHPAKFPEKLAEDHILSWSNEWDIVLDPFMWSGTTAKMALINNRNYIWFEISQEYVDIANKRIQDILSDNTLF